jgi:hypothetical protein
MSYADFLTEKANNMARWITAEVGQESLPVDIITGIGGCSAFEIVLLAGTLAANKTVVIHRDWLALMQILLANHQEDLHAVVRVVNGRNDLHTKFWRYMDLFVEAHEQYSEKE